MAKIYDIVLNDYATYFVDNLKEDLSIRGINQFIEDN